MSFFTQSHTTYSGKDQCILTPNTGTNTDTVVETLGTGACMRNIPDASGANGNERGNYANDFVRHRSNAGHVASGLCASILSGVDNQASNDYSTCLGGQQNAATGTNSSVLGGANNTSSNNCATTFGGHSNSSLTAFSFVGAGENNYVNNSYSQSTSYYGVVCGGYGNYIDNNMIILSGGEGADYSTICGGYQNNILNYFCFIGGGYQNNVVGDGIDPSRGLCAMGSIVGGSNNSINARLCTGAVIFGGYNNTIATGLGTACGVMGGTGNTCGTSSTNNGNCSVAGGNVNSIVDGSGSSPNKSFIGGGDNNTVNGAQAGTLGGYHLSLTQDCTAACGQYNTPGDISSGNARIFMVGYGSSGATKNLMSVVNFTNPLPGGWMVADTNYLIAAGADLGEMYESASGEAIPLGTPVTFQPGTNKIIPATQGYFSGSAPIGVISNTCMSIGNVAAEYWHDRYERDADGNIIMIDSFEERRKTEYKLVEEEIEEPVTEEVEETTYEFVNDKLKKVVRRVTKTHKVQRPLMDQWNVLDKYGRVVGTRAAPRTHKKKIQKKVPIEVAEKVPIRTQKENPLYRKNEKYVPRTDRKEWNVVGFRGKVKILKNSPVAKEWVKLETTDPKYDIYFIK